MRNAFQANVARPLKPIREFIDENRKLNNTLWASNFSREGYHSVPLRSREWETVHQWCVDTFDGRYTWTGHMFWFETKEDAMRFKLQWG
jgi:hypothetical protein